jgi:hypothetical protein
MPETPNDSVSDPVDPSSDPFVARLAALAPAVDLDASRELFERHRQRPVTSRRWLLSAAAVTLLVAGVVGVWAIARTGDSSTVPVAPTGTSTADDPTDGEVTAEPDVDQPVDDVAMTWPATGDEFVMLAVEETQLEFGSILVADDAEDFGQMWAQSFDEAEQPTVDFDHLVAAAFTLPDDACPDILTHFDLEPAAEEGPTVWEPQFEPPPGGCRLPLITRTYVVGIDRQALGSLVTFRLPGDDVYDFETNTVTVTIGPPEPGATPAQEPTLTPTGALIPLPPVGDPRIAVGTFGIVWVVQHADGTVSVLDAVVERRPDEDDGGVTGLGDLVVPTTTGDGFGNGSFVWDSHGRAVNGPRTSDLTGFTGKVVDGEVELFLSDAATIPGSSEPFTGEFGPPRLESLPLLDLGTLPTLSFSGPIWRYLDATLVVENGVGTLCSVDPTASVDALATCDDGYPTAVRSTQPEITSWHFGPLLAEFDDFGRIVQVAPLGGRASRNDGPGDGGTEPPSGDGWRLLSESWNTELTGLPHLAVDARSLAELENDAGPLDVDLDEQFVVAVSVFGNSCPPEVAAVDVEDGQVAIRFKRSPALSCDDVGIVYGFVMAIDRAVTGDVVSVLATDPAGLPAAHETMFHVRSGDLLEGGLVFQQFEPVFVDCGTAMDELDLVVPLETAIEREVTVVVHDTDEEPLASRSIVLTTGMSEVRVPFPGDLAGDLAIRVTSIDPPAQLERTVTLSAADIADTTRGCG